jgi:hypothetical protein
MIAVGLAVFVIAKPLTWRRGRKSAVSIAMLVVPVVAFFFSFANTPMPRYQGANLWIFAIDLLVLAFALADDGSSGRVRRAAVVAIALLGAALPLCRSGDPWLPFQDFEIASAPRVHDERLASGMVVGMPENQVCWWAPLPCSPEQHPGLRLRDPRNLGAGFAIDLLPPPAP